jgi:hypothetical protein
MKKIIITLLAMCFFASCKETSTIENNPIIEQININDAQSAFKYEVYFKTKTESEDSKMLTNFRYQIGDTLISYIEFFESKLRPTQDSLVFYRQKYLEVSKENVNLTINLKYLEGKLEKIGQK